MNIINRSVTATALVIMLSLFSDASTAAECTQNGTQESPVGGGVKTITFFRNTGNVPIMALCYNRGMEFLHQSRRARQYFFCVARPL